MRLSLQDKSDYILTVLIAEFCKNCENLIAYTRLFATVITSRLFHQGFLEYHPDIVRKLFRLLSLLQLPQRFLSLFP